MIGQCGVRRVTALAAAGLLALTMGACGGSDTASSGASSTPAPSTSADSTLAAKVPDAVKSDGKILVGTDASYAPSEFLDVDGKTIKGFDVDLFTAVAGKLGLKAQFENAKFDSLIQGVQSGKYEIGVSSFTINAERKKQALMISYYTAGTQWMTKKGNPAAVKPDDACGKKIAVQTGTVQVDDITKRSDACKAAGKQAIGVDSYQGQDQATAAVVSGKDDAGLADSPVIAYAVKQTNGQLELLGDVYEAAPYGYVVKSDQQQLAEAIQGAVKALIADGTYKTVLEKWNVQAGAVTDSAINP
jgi:polar amino acid transport system substrate-binding protein